MNVRPFSMWRRLNGERHPGFGLTQSVAAFLTTRLLCHPKSTIQRHDRFGGSGSGPAYWTMNAFGLLGGHLRSKWPSPLCHFPDQVDSVLVQAELIADGPRIRSRSFAKKVFSILRRRARD